MPIAGWLHSGMLHVVDRIYLRLSKNKVIDGLRVGVLSNEDGQEVLSRVQQALNLIKTCDPHRYNRVRRELKSILIIYLFGPAGSFSSEHRRCQLDVEFVMTSRPEVIASTIIHEGTHAYQFRRNIPYNEENRHRVEKACIRQEMAFAKKVLGGDALIQSIEHELELPPEAWSRSALHELRRASLVSADVRLPRWLHNMAIGVFDRRHRLNSRDAGSSRTTRCELLQRWRLVVRPACRKQALAHALHLSEKGRYVIVEH